MIRFYSGRVPFDELHSLSRHVDHAVNELIKEKKKKKSNFPLSHNYTSVQLFANRATRYSIVNAALPQLIVSLAGGLKVVSDTTIWTRVRGKKRIVIIPERDIACRHF